MKTKCRELLFALKLSQLNGNKALRETEGWTKVDIDVAMSSPLSETLKNKILEEVPLLEYWEDDGSPHNASDNGFICKEHKITITFPKN